jgi:hypothetical protein
MRTILHLIGVIYLLSACTVYYYPTPAVQYVEPAPVVYAPAPVILPGAPGYYPPVYTSPYIQYRHPWRNHR